MKVILKEDLDNLGLAGDVVEVKPGYGRNFLIPRGLAVVANDSNRRRFEEETRQRQHKIEAQRKDAEALARRLGGFELTIPMPTGEENRLFGTVTTQQVADALQAKGVEVDRRKITLAEEIRYTGVYTAVVKLHPEHVAEVKVKVVPEGGEPERSTPEASAPEDSAPEAEEPAA
jgi:large subunit ribosomal protein L9